MAKMNKRELEEIVKRDMPGFDVVSREPIDAGQDAPTAPAEAAPSIDQLRRKYLGDDAADATDEAADSPPARRRGAKAAPNTDDEIITVRPSAGSADPFDHASRPKTVIVSGKEKRVIGSQG
jgi:hypothetical protein